MVVFIVRFVVTNSAYRRFVFRAIALSTERNVTEHQFTPYIIPTVTFFKRLIMLVFTRNKYIYVGKNPIKQARLDFFLIYSMLYLKVKNPDITSVYRTDHSHISLDITLDKTDKGNSYWKFNDSLLRDIQYVNKIKGLINIIKLQYSTNPQQGENSLLNDRDIQFNINDQLFFETLMMER